MERFVVQACSMIGLGKVSVLLMATGVPVLFGQSFSIGVKSGARATEDFQGAATSQSRRYLVGPAAEVGLPLGFAIEFEALYRRKGYSTGSGTALYTRSIREADNVWEFPLLARYTIPVPNLRPFAEAGWAARITHGSSDVSGSYLSGPTSYTSYSGRTHMDWPTTHGLVVGGGLQFAAGRLQFAPEVRYTRWNQQVIYGYFPDGPSYGSSQNQLDILLGISWRIRRENTGAGPALEDRLQPARLSPDAGPMQRSCD
jgi:hypothetical protein